MRTATSATPSTTLRMTGGYARGISPRARIPLRSAPPEALAVVADEVSAVGDNGVTARPQPTTSKLASRERIASFPSPP